MSVYVLHIENEAILVSRFDFMKNKRFTFFNFMLKFFSLLSFLTGSKLCI